MKNVGQGFSLAKRFALHSYQRMVRIQEGKMSITQSLLTIHLHGPKVEQGRILLSDFIQIVQKTQLAVKRVALNILKKPKELGPGRLPKDIEKSCGLELLSVTQGSVEVQLDLATREKELFEEYKLGEKAIETVITGIDFIEKEPLSIPPNFDQGVLIALDELGRNLHPRKIENIEFKLRKKQQIVKTKYDTNLHKRVYQLLQKPTEGMTNLRGILLELNLEKQTCQIYPTENEYVRCEYEEGLEPLLMEALKGYVQVSGEAKFLPYKTLPEKLKIRYLQILKTEEHRIREKTTPETDPVLAMAGVGKEIWEGIDPDEYVRELRKGWK